MQRSIDRYRRTKDKPRKRKSAETQILMICVGVGLIVVVVLGMLLVFGDGSSGSGQRRPSARRSSNNSARTPRPRQRSPSWRGGTPPPSGPRTLADLMEQPDDAPIETDTVTAHLDTTRRAMAQRDLKVARLHTELAAELARSPTERGEVRRVQRLLDSLESFWGSVQEELGRLRSGQELPFEGTRIMVVNSSGGVLMVRASGKLRLYTVADMPRALAVTLAERGLPGGGPLISLHVGSFLAVDAQGDRQEARRRWQEAGESGKTLMPELELAPPVQAVEDPQPPPDPVPADDPA